MNHFYRVLTFVLCFMVSNLWGTNPPMEEIPQTICADLTASNTARCMNDSYHNTKYGGYLLFKNLESHYKLENGRFQESLDGTARLTGRWVNIEHTNIRFDVDIRFSGRTTTAPNDPKEHVCLTANPANFYYYTQTTGVLTGRNAAAGAKVEVARFGEAFQVGVGANITNKELSFGASGWLATRVVSQPSGSLRLEVQTSRAGGNGDININLSGNGNECLGSEITLNCPTDIITVAAAGDNGKVINWTIPVATTTCMKSTDPTCTSTNLSNFEYLGEFNGSRYYCSDKDNYTWLQARDKAMAAGGHLAVVCSAAENEFLKQGLLAPDAWIGFTDRGQEGNYKWVTGENCTYTNWASGEPNNHGGDEDFTRILKSSGKWTDRNAHYTAEFIMEIPCEGGMEPGNVATTQVEGPAPGSLFPIGTTKVKYEALDECGNMEMCMFTVTVEEPVDPCAGNGSPSVTVEGTDPDCGINNGKIKFTFGDNPNRTAIEFSLDGGQSYPLNVADNAGMAMFSDLAPGTYALFVRWGNDECAVDLGNVTLEDVRKPAGTECDDGDANTINDVILANGCDCGGTPKGEISLVCEDDIGIIAEPGDEGVIVIFDEPTASTTCGAGGLNVDQIEGPASGSLFPIGTTTVKYRATDACGNMEMCAFEVVIEETPLMFDILCADNIEVTAAVGEEGAIVTFSDPSVISNCPADGFTINQIAGPASGSLFPVGTTTVTFEVEDGCDQTAICSFTVKVNPAPTGEIIFICNDDIEAATAPGADGVVVNYTTPTAGTTCPFDGLNIDLTSGLASGSVFPIGVTTVTYTATDACGGVEICTFDVTVIRIEDPCLNEIVIDNKVCNDNGTPSNPADDTYTFDVIVMRTGGASATFKGFYDNEFLGAAAFNGNYGEAITLGPFPAGTFTSSNTNPPVTVENGLDINVSVEDANKPDCRDEVVVTSTGPCSDEDPKGSIGDFVFLDENRNGIQDPNELGIGEVTVKLQDANGTTLAETQTENDGSYIFEEVEAGDYKIMVNAPSGLVLSPADQGGNDDKDSDIQADGMTEVFTLAIGENKDDIDAGLNTPAPVKVKVGDIVFLDANSNGIQDENESGISGILVNLYDANEEIIAFVTSGDNGMYMFGDLNPGDYKLRFVGQADNLEVTLKDIGNNDAIDSDIDEDGFTETFTLTEGFDDSRDAGFKPKFVEPLPARIGNQVFLDANENGKKDDDEVGINGVEVKLLAANGDVIETTSTENDGMYGFSAPAGTYKVMFGTPFGFNPTNQSGNASDGIDNDSDNDPSTGMTETFTVAEGATNSTIDAGFVPTPDPCIADAGTLTIDATPVTLVDGSATISATPNGDEVVPTGFSKIFVLTKGTELVIVQVSETPNFTVSMAGKYTIHTLVYDATTLDLSIVVPNLTTGFDVNSLLIQGGGDICASLDVAGAMVMVMDEVNPCDNVTDGGKIAEDEDPRECGPYDAALITNVELPSGGSGDLEYIWLSSTIECPSELTDMIPGANDVTYDPGVLTETTYFVRCARRVGCDEWIESDCVIKKVEDCGTNNPADCDAVTATPSENKITVNGLVGSNSKVEILGAGTGWVPTLVCGDDGEACQNPQMITDLPAGDYTVKIQLWGADGSYCYTERKVTVTDGNPTCDVAAGTISTNDNTNDLCVDDNIPSIVNFTVNGGQGTNRAWVVTDANGTILNPDAPASINFEGAGSGACAVYYVRYENIEGLVEGANIEDLSGCFDKSNKIVVTRQENCGDPSCQVSAGTISTSDDITDLCVADNEPSIVNFAVSGGSATNGAWIVTDAVGQILNADAPSTIDFEGAGEGACNIYFVWYEEIQGLTDGQNIADLSGCFVLSNQITVTRKDNCDTGGEPQCEDVEVTTGNGKINLVGLSAPFVVVKIHDMNAGWAIIEQCINCEDPTTFTVPEGDYNVVIEFYRGYWNDKYCRKDVQVTVGGGDPCTDADGDGVCAEIDCDDNNPAIPAAVGTSCDDGDATTSNDQIQSDGCTCAGETDTNKEVCIEREVFNTDNCQFNIIYGLYLKLEGYDEYYQVSDANFVEYTDGTALFTATAINNTSPNIGWNIAVEFGGRTTLAEVAPKEHNCLAADVNDFYFYETLTGKLTGINDATGASMSISRIGPAFQLGIAANITHDGFVFGGSGWFVADMLTQPTNGPAIILNAGAQGQNGDININLSGDGTECIEGRDNSALDCGNVTAIATENGISIAGLTAPIEIVKVFDASWNPIENCTGDCGESLEVPAIPGNYLVRVNFYTANWVGECEIDIPVVVPGNANAASSRNAAQLNLHTFEDNRAVTVEWLTNTGYKNQSYEIEKSTDGTHFKSINKVDNTDNSDDLTYYKGKDQTPALGTNYYRVKQIYTDGSFDYSEVQLVNFNLDLQSLAVFPNPAKEELFVSLKAHVGQKANLQIINNYGQVLRQLEIDEIPNQAIRLDLGDMQNGLYHLSIRVDKSNIITKKILVSRLY